MPPEVLKDGAKLSDVFKALFTPYGIGDGETVMASHANQLLADAELGRLVRAMPTGSALKRFKEFRWQTRLNRLSADLSDNFATTPQEALRKALGIE